MLNMELIGKLLTGLIVVAAIGLMILIFWTVVFIPIVKRNSMIKQIEEEKKELLQIQVQKGVEWDNYKELTESNDKLRKAYFKEKDKVDKLKTEVAKEQVQKSALVTQNRELKKSQKA